MTKVRENHGTETTESPIKTSSSQLAGNYWFAPTGRWARRVEVTERCTKIDWAQQIQRLVDEDYPDKRSMLAMDNS